MQLAYRMILKQALLGFLVFTVAGCALPRSGPNKSEIYSGSVEKQGDVYIVDVNPAVVAATQRAPESGFPEAFIRAGRVGPDTIQPGDSISLTIYENVDDGLFSSQGAAASNLAGLQVDGTGFIYIPYAGRIKAAGNSPERLRQIVTEKLAMQTPDPQVIVMRSPGPGGTITISGNAGAQGVFPIEASTRTLSGMLASAGGVGADPKVARITVVRGTRKGAIWYQDLFTTPSLDIALRAGDQIFVETDPRTFTAAGATGNSLVPFPEAELSAMEALLLTGGLQSNLSDPTGVFVLRDEPAEIANRVLGRTDLTGTQRMAYVLNLTEPAGIFEARDFQIRDGDTIYVTEAPFVQWSKSIAAVTGTLGVANTFNSAANGGT